MTDGTYWNDGVTVSGCDGGADVAARFPGEGLLCQMHASDVGNVHLGQVANKVAPNLNLEDSQEDCVDVCSLWSHLQQWA